MRRSAAPSQVQANSFKKPKFIPPGRSNTSLNKETTEMGPDVKSFQGAKQSQDDPGVCSSNLRPTEDSTRAMGHGTRVDPLHTVHSASEEIIESKVQEEEPHSLLKYFSVVWCKASKKKHKKWEGDAILIVKGRSFTLKDLEGKDIGRGVGYKFSELENIEEGRTLVIGGKEVEILGPVSSDDFSSGKCFQRGCGSPSVPSSQAARKCFSNPFKSVCQSGQSKENRRNDWQNCKPRHDPHTPNSLVMPQPDQNHQRLFNRNCSPLVDVVVDPHLVRHLRSHQRDGVIFLYECVMGMRAHGRCGAILADEMGLGKTLQCISLIWTLQCQGPYGGKPVIKKTLIVTPGSLVTNWRKEFQKWLGSERIKIFPVDQDHKVEEFINSTFYSVLIISYEMLLRSVDLIKTVRFDLLICDEGHRLKNSSIKTAAALFSLSCEKRVILTGTPVQNDLQEFFALVDFVNPGILGSLLSYKKIYEEPIITSREPSSSKEEKELGERRAAELTCLTGLFTLRRTQEVVNKYLPPKTESVVFCRPGALQLELYRELLSSQSVRFCLQGLSENHLVCIGALKKLCNHPCLLFRPVKGKECSSSSEENEERNLCQGLLTVFPASYDPLQFSENESGKLQVLAKLLAAIRELRPTEKVVLVSNYRQTLNILEDVCKRHGYACARLDGQTPVSQRQQIVDSFNSKYSTDFIFLLSSKAGGVGLNLIGGSHLILYDIDWNPATDIQAMSRVWRDGQKHPVHIYRLLTTGTIEEKIYQRQISKQGLSGAVVDLTRSSEHIQFSVEELKDLFTLHEDSPCVTHDLLGCECRGGKDPTDDALDAPVTSGQCQPGPWHQKSRPLRPLSMSQLKQWQHISGDNLNLTDPFLERIRENASFFFQNVTNQAPAVQ
ncbi:DNA repair and recombination protein RAD54B [Arvicola amphibius]|uniref:DNA repair and recombination protein RAD54B n=1 Tax=Arvicola amphibius TaxID=1047088 RepID=UPI0018E2C48E|nr:DNA repair and recombination protein RAD54B [Arvicola amphibius]